MLAAILVSAFFSSSLLVVSVQIDPVTVKNLDKNLFLSDEIREVYREIMKTVPSDHLNLDHVSTISPPAVLSIRLYLLEVAMQN